MKGNPTVVSRARSRSQRPAKPVEPQVYKNTWCPCGSKLHITNGIKIAGKDVIHRCGKCAEKAPLGALITRIDSRQFKGPDNFNKVPINQKQESE